MIALPTITPVGMAAVLPGADTGFAIELDAKERLEISIAGTPVRSVKDRVQILEHAHGKVTGLAPLFEHVFSAVQVARGKPAPDLYLLAAKTLGEPPGRCIVIEDTVRGVAAGRAAGARVVGFAGAAHATPALAEDLARAGADVVIRAMDELPAVVRSLAA